MTPFLVSSLLFATLLIFIPGHMFLGNRSEFLIFFTEIIYFSLFPLSLLVFLLTSLLLFVPEGARKRVVSMTLAVAISIWFQGNLLVWEYGILDGSEIPWAELEYYGIIDTSVWLLLLVSAYLKPSLFYRFAKPLSLTLIATQLMSMLIVMVQAVDSHDGFFKKYQVEKNELFDFSSNANVILIVVDELQSDVVRNIFSEDPTYRDYFDGFVYFRNALSASSFTELAVPGLLTGEIYDNAVTRSEFLRESFLDNSLPKVLMERGFDVHMYPWRTLANRSVYYDEGLAMNFTRRLRSPEKKKYEWARVLDLSLFRSAPHFAKRLFYNDNQWRIAPMIQGHVSRSRERDSLERDPQSPPDDEIPFRKSFDREIRKLGEGKLEARFNNPRMIFKYYHLKGMHLPLTVTLEGRVERVPYNRENYTRQAREYLRTLKMFFDVLRQNKAYDNSLILVLGDHGSGRDDSMFIDPVHDALDSTLGKEVTWDDFQVHKARGVPVVLIKRSRARGGLQVSDAPVSSIDVPQTVLRELGIESRSKRTQSVDASFTGRSMFEISPDEKRTRYFAAFVWGAQESDYVNPITMYAVNGFSWSNKSWSVHGIFEPGSQQ